MEASEAVIEEMRELNLWPFISRPDAAMLLGVTVRTIDRYAAKGRLRHRKGTEGHGRDTYFHARAVAEILTESLAS